MITLHHHPFSRAADVIWMLEEVGVPYELAWTDLMQGDHKKPDYLDKNPMGKLPMLVDGEQIVTERAAIGLYLADRYAYGKLSPKVDDPLRGTYFRWSCYAPSVIEPATMAREGKWELKESRVGWGTYDHVVATLETALAGKDFLLGKDFSMVDCIVGGTIKYLVMTKALEERPLFATYIERISSRPASKRSDERNAAIMKEHDLKWG